MLKNSSVDLSKNPGLKVLLETHHFRDNGMPAKMRSLFQLEHDAAICQSNINCPVPEKCAKDQLNIGEEFAKDQSSMRSEEKSPLVHEYQSKTMSKVVHM